MLIARTPRAVFEKMVRDQMARQPNDHAEPAYLLGIPVPIAPPLDFGPDHCQEDAESREEQRNTAE
jgi:hypothetical protein